MSLLSRYLNLFTGTLVLLTFGFPVWFDGSKFFETFNEKTDNVHSNNANRSHFPMKHVSRKHVVFELKRVAWRFFKVWSRENHLYSFSKLRKDVFRNQSNTYDGNFCNNETDRQSLKTICFLRKKWACNHI